MSETLKAPEAGNENTEWDNLAGAPSSIVENELANTSDTVENLLANGMTAEEVIEKVYDEGNLTPDFIDEYGTLLTENGLNDEQLEKYDKMARQRLNQTVEDRRHRFDEESEQRGHETGTY